MGRRHPLNYHISIDEGLSTLFVTPTAQAGKRDSIRALATYVSGQLVPFDLLIAIAFPDRRCA